MMVHHSSIHGEKLGTISVECHYCGETFDRRRSELKNYDRNFCSNDCRFDWQSEDEWVDRMKEDLDLDNIGVRVETFCSVCGDGFSTYPCQVGKTIFCSNKCRGESIIGENHPNWRGGSAKKYGPDWEVTREKIIQRDGEKCSICSRRRCEERDIVGQDLVVHHITPRRYFIEREDLTLKEADTESNLTTLCHSCHAFVESGKKSIPQSGRLA